MAVELSGRLVVALTTQMNREVAAALVYKQMSSDLRLQGWLGFAKYFEEQFTEEVGHSKDFDRYLVDRNVRAAYGTVTLPDIPVYSTPLEYFQRALDLEKLYWVYIEDLYQLSEDEDDPDTCRMLYLKVEAQHDSVEELTTLVTKMRRAGQDVAAMQDIDSDIEEIVKQ